MSGSRWIWSRRLLASAAAATLVLAPGAYLPAQAKTAAGGVKPHAVGALDCNGFSPIQKNVKRTRICSDPRGYEGGRFYDNGHYIGHDEPTIQFISSAPGSGNNVTWTETLSKDPAALPTVSHPGNDVTHNFELSAAPWFSMALCNPGSFPQTPCSPNSDINASPCNLTLTCPPGVFPGGGSAFLEMQFYPPGFAPFVDNLSCDNTHWCASLHINDLECTENFASCNNACIEPTNFAFIQTDGVPTGPPSPQLANLATNTPNSHTLLMNPGDTIKATIFDTAVTGGHALETRIDDLTTGKSGFMIASAANGFMSTSIADCSGTPFNYEPEYSSASAINIVPWAALQANINTQFETGHFVACSSLAGPATLTVGTFKDKYFTTCRGAYEKASPKDGIKGNPELSDAPCYLKGDTHGHTAPPNKVSGCVLFFTQNGDLDFDGSPYYPDWPNSTTPNRFPSTFRQLQPTTNGGSGYPQVMMETDLAASESTCSPTTLTGCAAPPPNAPGKFYPFWSQALVGGQCVWEFGNMSNGNSFGGDAQYGGPSARFFGNLAGPVMANPHC
ncbi:MAG: hypothetical protein M3003_17680 [Candidatus Dormibacteraeota bacterium]|nr:hypothetical protein [Candidatus Dormibacteraeota bacterium]